MVFKRTATGVDNRDLKCISFALEIQGIIFYFSNFCASISSSDFSQKKKKIGSQRKMNVERQKSWPEGSPYGGHEADGGSQACMG